MPFCQLTACGTMGRARRRPYVSPVEAIRWKLETGTDWPANHAGEAGGAGGPEHQDASKDRSWADQHPRYDGHPAAQGARVLLGFAAKKVTLGQPRVDRARALDHADADDVRQRLGRSGIGENSLAPLLRGPWRTRPTCSEEARAVQVPELLWPETWPLRGPG